MDAKRLWRTIRLYTCKDRNKYIRKAHIFAEFGENSTMSSRKIPLYPELISIGNNVRLAANVSLVPHDMIHAMLNNLPQNLKGGIEPYREYIGAGTLVNKNLESGYVYAGVPAKKICTFEDFIEKRKQQVRYPKGFQRKGDSVGTKFADWMWRDFEDRCK